MADHEEENARMELIESLKKIEEQRNLDLANQAIFCIKGFGSEEPFFDRIKEHRNDPAARSKDIEDLFKDISREGSEYKIVTEKDAAKNEQGDPVFSSEGEGVKVVFQKNTTLKNAPFTLEIQENAAKFTGVFFINRINDDGSLIAGVYDMVAYENGKIVQVHSGSQGTSRLLNLDELIREVEAQAPAHEPVGLKDGLEKVKETSPLENEERGVVEKNGPMFRAKERNAVVDEAVVQAPGGKQMVEALEVVRPSPKSLATAFVAEEKVLDGKVGELADGIATQEIPQAKAASFVELDEINIGDAARKVADAVKDLYNTANHEEGKEAIKSDGGLLKTEEVSNGKVGELDDGTAEIKETPQAVAAAPLEKPGDNLRDAAEKLADAIKGLYGAAKPEDEREATNKILRATHKIMNELEDARSVGGAVNALLQAKRDKVEEAVLEDLGKKLEKTVAELVQAGSKEAVVDSVKPKVGEEVMPDFPSVPQVEPDVRGYVSGGDSSGYPAAVNGYGKSADYGDMRLSDDVEPDVRGYVSGGDSSGYPAAVNGYGKSADYGDMRLSDGEPAQGMNENEEFPTPPNHVSGDPTGYPAVVNGYEKSADYRDMRLSDENDDEDGSGGDSDKIEQDQSVPVKNNDMAMAAKTGFVGMFETHELVEKPKDERTVKLKATSGEMTNDSSPVTEAAQKVVASLQNLKNMMELLHVRHGEVNSNDALKNAAQNVADAVKKLLENAEAKSLKATHGELQNVAQDAIKNLIENAPDPLRKVAEDLANHVKNLVDVANSKVMQATHADLKAEPVSLNQTALNLANAVKDLSVEARSVVQGKSELEAVNKPALSLRDEVTQAKPVVQGKGELEAVNKPALSLKDEIKGFDKDSLKPAPLEAKPVVQGKGELEAVNKPALSLKDEIKGFEDSLKPVPKEDVHMSELKNAVQGRKEMSEIGALESVSTGEKIPVKPVNEDLLKKNQGQAAITEELKGHFKEEKISPAQIAQVVKEAREIGRNLRDGVARLESLQDMIDKALSPASSKELSSNPAFKPSIDGSNVKPSDLKPNATPNNKPSEGNSLW